MLIFNEDYDFRIVDCKLKPGECLFVLSIQSSYSQYTKFILDYRRALPYLTWVQPSCMNISLHSICISSQAAMMPQCTVYRLTGLNRCKKMISFTSSREQDWAPCFTDGALRSNGLKIFSKAMHVIIFYRPCIRSMSKNNSF